MSFEVMLENLNKVTINESGANKQSNQNHEIFHFLKYSYKYKIHECSDKKVEDIRNDFNKIFPFAEDKYKNSLKKIKMREFCLEWFKKEITSKKQNSIKLQIDNFNEEDNYKKSDNFHKLNTVMGIFNTKSDFQDYINKLIPGSFGLRYNFELESPYFSRDDDEFYIIDNPVMKEKVWKVPIIKGSSWKGALLKAARGKVSDLTKKGSVKDVLENYFSITRIFGTGSNEYRKLEDEIKKFIHEKGKKDESILVKQLFKYALSDLSLNLNIKKNGKRVAEQIFEQIIKQKEKLANPEYENLYAVKKGRAVFYPTYFYRLSLEVINPHNRNTKAGTKPIYYEVVPSKSTGTLQIIYIPYDSITVSMEELKIQVEFDYNLLKELIVNVFEEVGIGAKTKLGWGRALIKEENCFANMEGICDE